MLKREKKNPAHDIETGINIRNQFPVSTGNLQLLSSSLHHDFLRAGNTGIDLRWKLCFDIFIIKMSWTTWMSVYVDKVKIRRLRIPLSIIYPQPEKSWCYCTPPWHASLKSERAIRYLWGENVGNPSELWFLFSRQISVCVWIFESGWCMFAYVYIKTIQCWLVIIPLLKWSAGGV